MRTRVATHEEIAFQQTPGKERNEAFEEFRLDFCDLAGAPDLHDVKIEQVTGDDPKRVYYRIYHSGREIDRRYDFPICERQSEERINAVLAELRRELENGGARPASAG